MQSNCDNYLIKRLFFDIFVPSHNQVDKMKIILQDRSTKTNHLATISKVEKKDIPPKKGKWRFNWKELFEVEGADFFKISLNESPKVVEGILMISIFNEEMVFMNNLEIAPHNYGSKGSFKNVAGCLIAYACRESFKKGRGDYKGFLSFDSKTRLIELYQNKYGAKLAMGHKMYFDSGIANILIKKYLNIKIKNNEK